jgi:hypothetical protein
MSIDLISSAFDTYLGEFVTPLDIAWEGVVYVPTAGRPYLAPTMASYSRAPAGLGDNTLMVESGAYSITVNWPVGQGKAPALAVASALVAYFNRHVSFSLTSGRTVTINGASAMAANEANGWLTVPVIVRWLSDEPETG